MKLFSQRPGHTADHRKQSSKLRMNGTLPPCHLYAHDLMLSHMVEAEDFAEPRKTERKIEATNALLQPPHPPPISSVKKCCGHLSSHQPSIPFVTLCLVCWDAVHRGHDRAGRVRTEMCGAFTAACSHGLQIFFCSSFAFLIQPENKFTWGVDVCVQCLHNRSLYVGVANERIII
jgi:hypothetical protein